MADMKFVVQNEANVAMVAATAKTILQILAPTNQRVKILNFGMAFDGASVTAVPVLVEIVRQSTAGTGGTAYTPKKLDDSLTETILSTALTNIVTTEPTTGDILFTFLVHPQQCYREIAAFGYELKCGGADRVGVRVTAPAAVNCRAIMQCEE